MNINANHHQGALFYFPLFMLAIYYTLRTRPTSEETGEHVLPGGEASLCCCRQDRMEVQLLGVGQLEVKLCSGQRQRQNFPGEEKLHMRT